MSWARVYVDRNLLLIFTITNIFLLIVQTSHFAKMLHVDEMDCQVCIALSWIIGKRLDRV